MRAGEFTFDDFPRELTDAAAMGPLQGRALAHPGIGKQLQGVDIDEDS
jgi:signal recognition particle GTPase